MASVKPGSMVYIDQWFGVAEEEFAGIAFDVSGDAPRKGWKKLIALGFGHEDNYGSGSVFAKASDLIEMDECDYCGKPFPSVDADAKAAEEDNCVCRACVSYHEAQMKAILVDRETEGD